MEITNLPGLTIKPSDGLFRNIMIKSIGADNMTLLQEISKDNTIYFKVIGSNSVEHKIYKALSRLNGKIPNMIKIYGSFGCKIKKSSFDKIKKKYEQLNNKKIDVNLCKTYDDLNNLSDKEIYLKFVALENLTVNKYYQINNAIDNDIRLNNDMFCSLLIQGLYQFYIYYMQFGIIHYDCNASNIMINLDQNNTNEIITYQVDKYPRRAYKTSMISKCDDLDYIFYDIHIKTFGIKIFIIDFDNADILHCDYNKGKFSIQSNIIKKFKNFIINIFNYAPNDIQHKLMNYFKRDEYDFTVNCINKYIERYNESPKHYSDNDYFLSKTNHIFLWHISNLIELLNMPKEYNIYKMR